MSHQALTHTLSVFLRNASFATCVVLHLVKFLELHNVGHQNNFLADQNYIFNVPAQQRIKIGKFIRYLPIRSDRIRWYQITDITVQKHSKRWP